MGTTDNDYKKYLMKKKDTDPRYDTEKKHKLDEIIRELNYQKVEIKKIDLVE